MKKSLLAAALVVGSLTLAGNTAPVYAQAGAGSDVATPRRSVPRVGQEKRDDSMNAGQRRHRHHRMHKRMMRRKKHKDA
jgi:predicted small secreted protein